MVVNGTSSEKEKKKKKDCVCDDGEWHKMQEKEEEVKGLCL